MTLTAKVFVVLLIAFGLAGCGQSGPLFVPGDPSSVKETPSSESSVEISEEDNEEDDG